MEILLAVSRFPWPPRRGDQMRAVQTLEALVPEHRVTLLAPHPPPGAAVPAGTVGRRLRVVPYHPGGAVARVRGAVRALLGGLPLQSTLFHAPELARALRRLAPGADLVVLQLARLAGMAREVGPTPLVVDLIDSLALNVSRRARFDRAWRAPLLRAEAHRLARWEARLLERSARGVVVCERDRRAILEHAPQLAPRLSVVPLAMQPAEPPVPPAGGGRLAITGNLGYFVTVDGALWFLDRVWPELLRRRPGLELVVAGARPAAALRRAVAATGATLIEEPPDLPAVLASATLALAPLRAGSGTPVKILEAWAAGVPVVASPWAAAGTAGRAGEELVVVEEPHAWVASILDLLDDPARRRRLAVAGRRHLVAVHAATEVGRQWRRLVGQPGAVPAGAP